MERKDYPTEKLQAMVSKYEATMFAADRGERVFDKPEFMWEALLAGERWEAEEVERQTELANQITDLQDALRLTIMDVNKALRDGRFDLVANLSKTQAEQGELLKNLEKTYVERVRNA